MEQKFRYPLFGIISGAFIYSQADFFLTPSRNVSATSKKSQNLKSQGKRAPGWGRRGEKKKRGRRMDIVSSTGSGRARIFIVTSLNRSKVSLSLHNERLC